MYKRQTTARGTAIARRAEAIMGRPPAGLTDLPDAEMETVARILEAAARPAPA